MALDTAARRRAAAGVPHLPCGPGVTPDAAADAAWRRAVAWGILETAAPAPGLVVAAAWAAEPPSQGPAWAAGGSFDGWAAE